MKTITIRLSDVEAAMLVEVQKVNRAYKDIQALIAKQINQEYVKTQRSKAGNWFICSNALFLGTLVRALF